MKKSKQARLLFFLTFFGLTGTLLVLKCGLGTGIYTTLLVWSFFVLCIPIPQSALLTSTILSFVSQRTITYAALFPWFFAIAINLFTYTAFPYIYLQSVTTFLLYRIISHPWPYWAIIGVSSLNSLYHVFLARSAFQQRQIRHLVAKGALFCLGITTFFYLAYFELVVLFAAKTFE